MIEQPFKPIQLTGIDKKQSKEGSPTLIKSTYILTVSSSPQPGWLDIFNQLWQARKKAEPTTPEVNFNQGRLTLICSITDDPQAHINNLEEDFEIANQQYAEKLKEETDKETAFQERLDKLKFKDKV
jgi:hypothetical protein